MHQRLHVLSLICSTLMLVAASSSPVPALRSIPVFEDTAMPGTSASSYLYCETLDLSAFSASIIKESDECAMKTSYMWTGVLLPTASERRELCSCTDLMNRLQEVKVPRCFLLRDGGQITYAQVIKYAFGLCNLDGTATTAAPNSPSTISTRDPSSTDTTNGTKSESTSKTGLIVGIIIGVVVVVALAAFAAFKCGRKRGPVAKNEAAQVEEHGTLEAMPLSPLEGSGHDYIAISPTLTASAYPVNTGKAVAAMRSTQLTATSTGSTGRTSVGDQFVLRPSELAKWEDPALVAARVPYDTVFFGPLLSRGGYGEVFKGTYNGETVAIKRLLPERRKDLAQIDAFLGEVKLMSTLEHERIIQFIGVAWNALSDACVIVEYMENGDLRSAITRWDRDEIRPQGFDADKVKIALHIAHALTYLHSLQPVVVHRDLKSKNIVLNATYDAKLTDFGVSRERADSTMTGGVGSSLWMAPEVMLGERYDEKADIFSFGVVLSELDTQKLPYDHAKETGTDRKVADSAILQMVSLGRLEVAFTEHAYPDLVQLGRDCVQLDSKSRPTSAAVLHRVHTALRNF